MQSHRHRQIEAALLVRIAVLIEELAKKTDAEIQKKRKGDQAILWNNTFAHCHHDGDGPTIGTDREVTPQFLRPSVESEIPKACTSVFKSVSDITPALTFCRDDDDQKKIVANHWDIFCGYPEKSFGQISSPNPAQGDASNKEETETDLEARDAFFGSNFSKINTNVKKEEEPKN